MFTVAVNVKGLFKTCVDGLLNSDTFTFNESKDFTWVFYRPTINNLWHSAIVKCLFVPDYELHFVPGPRKTEELGFNIQTGFNFLISR